ncbi:protein translocase subunit SecF [Nocardioides sp. Kera G14]|uniref:protein translocase subunit SecF n=1 Tax=Nocardioides sp. Kera G14 TaxID=2884264 RepID=UPI001D11ABBA|nr:protein translocase subunit SecF [Nocardioides sp. Kera G14]UDY22177.1 protein translocase subunit SecF [Nocardioides sp. Kera G14]
MFNFAKLGHDLYTGEKSFDFIGRRPLWYTISGGIVLAALLIVLFRGFSFGVEFTGGTEIQVSGLSSSQATQKTVDELRTKIADAGIPGAEEPTVSTSGNDGITVQVEELSQANDAKIIDVITSVVHVDDETKQISPTEIGGSWGKEVAQRAITGVILFVLLAMLFIGAYFREWKMSVAAFVALFHDVVITMGVYSLSGFRVTPAAVTGLLAILGFSLYDTVVVFDKIRENTKNLRGSRLGYAGEANLAVNQTLVRSINTSIVALIPIGSILFTSAILLGSSSLKDLALSQFVGMAAGVFSSVWVAPRILVHLKSTEDEVKLQERRAKARARAAADKYAAVPTFREGMPVSESAPELEDLEFELETGDAVIRKPARGPIRDSGAAGRSQPTRKPRSQRGKK